MIYPCVPSTSFPRVQQSPARVSDAQLCGMTAAVLSPALAGGLSLPDPIPSAGSRSRSPAGRRLSAVPAPCRSRGSAGSSTATGRPSGQAVLPAFCLLCWQQRHLLRPGLSRRCFVKGGGRNKAVSLSSPFSQGTGGRQRDGRLSDGSSSRREPCWLC